MPSISRYIMTIARCSNQFRSERLQGTGLCGRHCAYILRVCRAPGTTQDAIAKEIYVNKSNVTRQLAALEQALWNAAPVKPIPAPWRFIQQKRRLQCCRRCAQCCKNGMHTLQRISVKKRRSSSAASLRARQRVRSNAWMK